ncbi:MAG TPA: endonuclease/exonuclease/phosphatase family protein [Jatrophihabitans sp.]|jgi:endonuclease/exonuclease/phosphatase family metal-dependent hydrolase|uniref:endonuclease/exonuclease/phosphatase family protein n=1 Tax=Jatrophihabitans sp. TaxID=1932789 RepID=UPI002F1A064B
MSHDLSRPTAPAGRRGRTRTAAVRWRIAAGLVAIGATVAASLVPTAAQAASQPVVPTGIRVAAVTASSFTVTANRATNAVYYRLFASTVKSDVYVVNISRARASALSTTPRMTISGLPYTTAPYWFRVETINGGYRNWSGYFSVGLRPAVPTGLAISNSAKGTYLTWKSGAATGYEIAEGTDPGLTLNRRNYRIRGGLLRQFTPYGMIKGRTYYFRVQALNGTTGSGYSALVSAVKATNQQRLSVMTYNILRAASDGGIAGGQVIAPWSQRQPKVVGYIKQSNPDMIGVQEGGSWAYGVVKGPRQIDTLTSALGGVYRLARTEIPPTEPAYTRTGNYILYKAATYQTVGTGWHWTMPSGHQASYQGLQNRLTGARVVFVVPHLGVESTDAVRLADMKWLMSTASTYAASLRASVIYAGDFNSNANRYHLYDGPSVAARAVHVADGLDSAQWLANQRYNSANGYQRTPPAFGHSIDHVYAPPGVAIVSWRLLLNLTNGSFVGVMPSDHNPLVADMTIPY